MTKKELEKLEARYKAKAERAYEKYQETGIQRYANEWRNAEDLSDALFMAINASDEHAELIHLRGTMSMFAVAAKDVLWGGSQVEKDDLLKDIVSYGVMAGFIRKEKQ